MEAIIWLIGIMALTYGVRYGAARIASKSKRARINVIVIALAAAGVLFWLSVQGR